MDSMYYGDTLIVDLDAGTTEEVDFVEADEADRPALLIGMNWLRRFSRVSIDYGRKELRFELAKRAVAVNA